jgi:uncharacterized protein (UPF0332 family)
VTEIARLLEKAARSFQSAERQLAVGDADFAVSRAYYGWFYIAEALLLFEGVEFSSHKQVVAQYGLRFSQTEKLDQRFHRTLIEAFRLRQLADYQTEVPIKSEVVEELIKEGKNFLADASYYLDEHPGSAEGGERDDG